MRAMLLMSSLALLAACTPVGLPWQISADRNNDDKPSISTNQPHNPVKGAVR